MPPSGKSATSSDNAAQADSTAVSDNSAETAVKEFSTPDLTYAQVKGNVKKVIDIDPKFGESGAYVFDKDGNLVSCAIYNVKDFVRDEQGRIISCSTDFKLTWENDLPTKLATHDSDGTMNTFTYTYDADGNLVKELCSSDGPEGEYSYTITYTYSPDSFDNHGNWLSRSCHSVTPEADQTYTQQRKITYFQ